DVSVLLTEGVVETTAKVRFRGPARDWRLVTPPNAEVSADRASPAESGPTQPATITKPADAKVPVWTISFPPGSTPSAWAVTVVTRQTRPNPADPGHRGPFD